MACSKDDQTIINILLIGECIKYVGDTTDRTKERYFLRVGQDKTAFNSKTNCRLLRK